MRDWLRKHFALLYGILLIGFTVYAALDTFVIPHRIEVVESENAGTDDSSADRSKEAGAEGAAAGGGEEIATDPSETSAATEKSTTAGTSSAGETSTEEETSAGETDRKRHAPGSREGMKPSGRPSSGRKSESAGGSEQTERRAGTSDSLQDGSSSAEPSQSASGSAEQGLASGDAAITTEEASVIGTYEDETVSVTLTCQRVNDTTVYVADVRLSDIDALKTAFAEDTYGRNVKEYTSVIAEGKQAILAINGDFYGARNSGYVLRNGVLYRDTASGNTEDLALMADGSFQIVQENDVSAQELLEQGALQVWSFGPALVMDREVSVTEAEEVGKAMASNPRTAIAEVEPLHYLFVVADGRTGESAGLSLHELAEFLQEQGVRTAYNLDGGGSSTLWFQGEVINQPTTGGNTIKERSVSDIVYIG